MKQSKKIILFILILIALSFLCTSAVSADVGLKPELYIYVKNPPKETYYLDLLIQNSSENKFENLNDKSIYNQNMLSLLYSKKEEGWLPALTDGTDLPLHGELIGEPKDGDMLHFFGYIGVPKTYRIIIVTESGKVTVSDVITRKSMFSTAYFDYGTETLSEANLTDTYLLQFLLTCLPTLFIEGIILLFFGFKLKTNWKPFFIVNILTQIALTAVVSFAFIRIGPSAAILIQIPIELIIMFAEAFAYRNYLVGQSKDRAFIYGITANAVSMLYGTLVTFALLM